MTSRYLENEMEILYDLPSYDPPSYDPPPYRESTEEGESSKTLHQQQRATSLAKQVTLSINDELKDIQPTKDNRQQDAELLEISVNDMLSKVHLSYSPPCIYRVPDSIRGLNPQCYTPRLVSIGPFHLDNLRLKLTEGLKIKYFNNFLDRKPTDKSKLRKMTLLVTDMESDIRKHYPPNEIKLNSEDFCRMILLDATFIVELIIVLQGEGDPMIEKPWFIRNLLNDILLIENQIPLFIIYDIYLKFYREESSGFPAYGLYAEKNTFLIRIHEFIKNVKNVIITDDVPFEISTRTSSSMPEEYPLHFIDYLRQAYGFGVSDLKDIMPSSLLMNPKQEKEKLHLKYIRGKQKVLNDGQLSRLKSIKGKEQVIEIGLPSSSLVEEKENGKPCGKNRRPNQTLLPPKKKNWKSDVVTASRLLKYGVQFEEGTTTSLKDITFKPRQGILKINKVIVNESTENIFRNIVAYEQCDLVSQTYVSDYLIFMDSLIDTPEDVNILTDAGIIQNDLRDDEKVSQMFNTLHKEVITERRDYLFFAQSRELNDYRRNMWHRLQAIWFDWKLILKRDYFYSPWSIFAFIITTILVSLTIVQTVCSIYQAKGIKMK